MYISREDPDYPERLRLLPGMPKGLYVKGSLPDSGPSAAIVGARKCTVYGHKQSYAFGHYLASRGVQIISGMALGIDGYAQEGALDAGGKTFAVLGCGVDCCYPRSNRPLYNRIPEKGGILSELPEGTAPYAHFFPARNRIISALADLVLVIEAAEQSGSLITADFALEQGRTVYALPGRVGDRLSDGCNRLIYQGAGIAVSAEAVYEDLMSLYEGKTRSIRSSRQTDYPPAHKKRSVRKAGASPSPTPQAKPEPALAQTQREIADPLSRSILNLFRNETILSVDELSDRLSLSPAELAPRLVELSILGYLEEYGRNRFALRTAPL